LKFLFIADLGHTQAAAEYLGAISSLFSILLFVTLSRSLELETHVLSTMGVICH